MLANGSRISRIFKDNSLPCWQALLFLSQRNRLSHTKKSELTQSTQNFRLVLRWTSALSALLYLVISTKDSFAMSWQDWWLRPDQQGAKLLAQGKPDSAAQRFTHFQWRASAWYRAHEFAKAAEGFAQSHNATAYYNRGNALAQLGKFNEAIAAYNQALSTDPQNQDARYNRDLLQQYLAQHPPQKQDASNNHTSDSTPSKEQNNTETQQSSSSQKANPPPPRDSRQNGENKEERQSPEKPSSPPSTGNAERTQDPNTSSNQTSPTQEKKRSNLSAQQQEEQLAKEQWLRRIPDHPSGLLAQKFLREHLRAKQ